MKRLAALLLLGLCAAAPSVRAQSVAKDKREAVDDISQAAATAAGAVGMRQPTCVLSVVLAGQSMSLWDALPASPPARPGNAPAKALPVDPDLLLGVEDRAPVRNADENYDEFQAYNLLLVRAHKTAAGAFAKGARRDLTFAHLFEEPAKYRGQIVHIEGLLRRLRKFDAARLAAKEGVPALYEGWVFDAEYGYNPYCVIVTELPKSIQIGEKLDRHVSFDGYFFKRYRYKAGDGVRDAPLLIGRTLTPSASQGTAANARAPWLDSSTPWVLIAFLAILLVTAGFGIALTLWFKRGDKQVRARLDAARDAAFVEPGE
ncbi:MAG: hypothetical protein E6K70_17050 [Planctomycetota bacterium]|nr:MAG: hypothetical protein E6K70_17050 [Planctomycetota bacterium]